MGKGDAGNSVDLRAFQPPNQWTRFQSRRQNGGFGGEATVAVWPQASRRSGSEAPDRKPALRVGRLLAPGAKVQIKACVCDSRARKSTELAAFPLRANQRTCIRFRGAAPFRERNDPRPIQCIAIPSGASMGPLPFESGMPSTSSKTTCESCASMGPLPFESGMRKGGCSKPRESQGFNGAAPFRERNEAPDTSCLCSVWPASMGPLPFESGMIAMEDDREVRDTMLQWGRSLSRAECGAVLCDGTTLEIKLQWGRSLSRAECHQRRRPDGRGVGDASMGPLPFESGMSPIHRIDRPHHSASMGPLPFESGMMRALRPVRRGKYHASMGPLPFESGMNEGTVRRTQGRSESFNGAAPFRERNAHGG